MRIPKWKNAAYPIDQIRDQDYRPDFEERQLCKEAAFLWSLALLIMPTIMAIWSVLTPSPTDGKDKVSIHFKKELILRNSKNDSSDVP